MLKPIQEDIVKNFRLLRDSLRKGIDFEMEATETNFLNWNNMCILSVLLLEMKVLISLFYL